MTLIERILENPIPFAHSIGYTKLREDIHKEWIRTILFLKKDGTLQAHRGSYKTSCVIIAITLWMLTRPKENLIFLRKSHEDVKDVLTAVSKNLQSDVCMELAKSIYGVYPKLTIDNFSELELNTYRGKMGRQILGLGLKSSITGKHGSILTDDIITLKDRLSSAERTATQSQYMELANIASEEGQNIYNTGTPWHKNDAFTLMPKPERYTVYDTGILSQEAIEERKGKMTGSLWAANYELKHIADGDILFVEPEYGAFPKEAKAYAHIDAAYGGPDSSALTIIAEISGKLYTIGWKMEGHIEKHYNEITSRLNRFNVRRCILEDNADKGYLKKELSRRMSPGLFYGYHEKTNKYYKITTYGKSEWDRVIMCIDDANENQSLEYIEEIMDFNENADHDDCPDSFASLVRKYYYKGTTGMSVSEYEIPGI